MATPTLRTVFGTAVYGDGTGASGVLTFTPQVLFVTTDTVVLPAPVRVIAGNGGTFSVDLAVTDDAAYSPTGWVWQVSEGWPGGRTFTFELPEGDGSDVNYVTLVPAGSVADPYEAHVHPQYLTAGDISGLVTSVNGEGGDVVLDAADVGAYPDTNPSGFVDASGAAAAAPVQSVNTQTGDVVLDAADVGALPDDAELGDLSDVDTAVEVAGDLLNFDGATWVPTSEPTVYTLNFKTDGAELEPADGQMVWNTEEGTVDLGLNGINSTLLHIGQEMVYRIENQSGGPIAKGQLVGFAGTVGASGKLLGHLYDASIHPAKTAMGVAAELIPNGELGYVVAFGKVRKIDTDVPTWNEEDILYADPATPGGLTNVPPQAPNAIVTVAALVTKSEQAGELFVRPTFAPTLTETQDVLISTPATGQVLVYDAAAGLWENSTLTAGDVGAAPDSHLTDTDPHPQYMTRAEVEGIFVGEWSGEASYVAGDIVSVSDSMDFQAEMFNAHSSFYRALQDFPSGSPDPRLWPEVWEFLSGFERSFLQFNYVGTKNPAVDPLNNYDVFNQGPGTGLFFYFNGSTIPFAAETNFDAPPIGTVFADPVAWAAGSYDAGLLVEYTLPDTTVLVFLSNTATTGEPTQSPDWDFVEVRPRFLSQLPTLSVDQLIGVEFSGPAAQDDVLSFQAGPGIWTPGPLPAHASTHATGGSDELTPSDIGAVPVSAGILVVEHGADDTVARPTAAVVYWIGSVAPLNAQAADLWYDTSGGA